jgi:hypothetical protein
MFKIPQWSEDYFNGEFNVESFRPNWKIELQLVTVPVSDFAAMTMGCQTDLVSGDPSHKVLSNKGKASSKKALEQRLKVIYNHLYAGNFRANKNRDGEWYCNLKETTKWAHELQWELPAPMLKLIEADIKSTQSKMFDNSSPTYPLELDIAMRAWSAVSTTEGKGKPKARIMAWLNTNTDLSNEAKKRIATVANWDKTGGATRTG